MYSVVCSDCCELAAFNSRYDVRAMRSRVMIGPVSPCGIITIVSWIRVERGRDRGSLLTRILAEIYASIYCALVESLVQAHLLNNGVFQSDPRSGMLHSQYLNHEPTPAVSRLLQWTVY